MPDNEEQLSPEQELEALQQTEFPDEDEFDELDQTPVDQGFEGGGVE